MKIANTTGDFALWCKTDEERIRELHKAGFQYIDLSMYSFTPDSPYMQENWTEEVQKIKDLAKELGMQFVQAHSQGGNPFSTDKAHVDFLIKATLRSIEICGMLGIKNTVVHPGFAPEFCTQETRRKWLERNKEFYEMLLPTAEKYGVNILCENGTKANLGEMNQITTGKEMREFIEYIHHPRLKGCWDTGHANCEGNQYDEIMAIGEHLYAIHYNDNRGAADEHVAPFLGTLNHDEVINALIDMGYQGYFTLECDASLRKYNQWTGERKRFEKESRCREPQLFMQRHIEKMMYETCEWLLSSYGILEK